MGRGHRTGIEQYRILKKYGPSSVILTFISRTTLKVYCDLLLFPENREITVNINNFLVLFLFDPHCMCKQHGQRSEEDMLRVQGAEKGFKNSFHFSAVSRFLMVRLVSRGNSK